MKVNYYTVDLIDNKKDKIIYSRIVTAYTRTEALVLSLDFFKKIYHSGYEIWEEILIKIKKD